MSADARLGVAFVLLGGVLSGSFLLPMKRMKAWPWENVWIIYSFVALLVVPWASALISVPHVGEVLGHARASTLTTVSLFGFGWGVGNILFGLGVSRVGMALGFAIILGVTAALGSLFPLLVLHPDQLLSRQGYALMAGLVLVILGIMICSVSGRWRERDTPAPSQPGSRSRFATGLTICIFSGIFSAMLNFGFVFGKELQQLSLSEGASPSMSANLIWGVALTSGFVANGGYCLYLLNKNRGWNLFVRPRPPVGYWVGAIIMGLLWFGGVVTYGMGAAALGKLGGILAWPLYMSMIIISGNVCGAIAGEWAEASRRTYFYSWMGIGILILAIGVISIGGMI